MLFILTQLQAFSKHYFYNSTQKIGSETFFNPATVYINSGFDYLRNGRIVGNPFKNKAFTLLNDNLINFPETISNYNNNSDFNFWEKEIFPLVWEKKHASWLPNYKSHLIGEGLLCRKMAEWYDSKGFSYPYLYGVISTFAFQYTNEWIEYT